MKIVITGSSGFLGKNLRTHLQFYENAEVVCIDRSTNDLYKSLQNADVIFHLAGVNRTGNEIDFVECNGNFTKQLVELLEKSGKAYKLIFSSSTQALQDNAYGKSKLAAENYLKEHVRKGEAIIYRLPGVFGKWCKPDYNSVVATFCKNIALDLPISIRDEDFELNLVYVDDVCKEFLENTLLTTGAGTISHKDVSPVYSITLGKLADMIQQFKQSRDSLMVPQVGDSLTKKLYSTYLTYLPVDNFSYPLNLRTDNRGNLFELFKSSTAGQIFLSTTLPGITRGNHFHHTKAEKFCVIAGEASIKLRKANEDTLIEYNVSGSNPTVVDIPPGYVHNITNTGSTELITLFWANEIFYPEAADTFFAEVEVK